MTEGAGSGSRLNRVRVTIAGDEYNLRTDEPPKHVEKLAARVDRELRELASRFPGVPLERLAVLLALRLTSQLERAREQARLGRKTSRPEQSLTPGSPPAAAEPSTRGEAGPSEAAAARTASGGRASLFDSPQGEPTL
ncbi:MAG: cell division protein ZapA [Bacillota bacterium]|nr:cell division protein ZapA [Bacillota bacterium]